MAVSKEIGSALGKLFSNLKNPRWIGSQAGSMAASYFVLNPLGKKVAAWFQHHLHHDEGHLGAVYKCADGHEYIITSNADAAYRYDPKTDSWYHATPPKN